jgi:hypothetical protein
MTRFIDGFLTVIIYSLSTLANIGHHDDDDGGSF